MHVREHSSHKGNECKYNTEIQVGLILRLVFLDSITKETKSGSEPKKKGEETSHFLDENDIPRKGVLLGQDVHSVFFD